MIRIQDDRQGVTPGEEILLAYHRATSGGDWVAESRSYGRQVMLIRYRDGGGADRWAVYTDDTDGCRTIDDGDNEAEARAGYWVAVLDQVRRRGTFDMSDVPGCGLPEDEYITWTLTVADLEQPAR